MPQRSGCVLRNCTPGPGHPWESSPRHGFVGQANLRRSRHRGADVVRHRDIRVLPVGGLIWTPNADNRLEWFRNQSVAGVAEVGSVFARTISANRVPEFNPTDTIMLSAGATF